MSDLLQQFFSEDCDLDVRKLLLDAMAQFVSGGEDVIREFTFNRFNIKLDFGASEVMLEDDLDPSSEGQQTLCLGEFREALKKNG